VDRSFHPEYDALQWESGARADDLFAAWCEGRTGFPIVDAAMAQINATGFMHNRLRMVTASFLVKDLGIDWRLGERYFAEKLNDYDLAANNGNWQWAASTGCDAQPYFRIFNPDSQQARFDPEGAFVRHWLDGRAPAAPIVNHAEARELALKRYAAARKNGACGRRPIAGTATSGGDGLRALRAVVTHEREQFLLGVRLTQVMVHAELLRMLAVLLRDA
jgi:deoxyribodipyrimidine photo-lyase